jgi:P27 family predicted phage terminase small subunit
MRGRKPEPTHLKLIKGNPGKRRINEREPVPTSQLPSPPSHLSDGAKVEWGRVSEELYRLGLLTGVDRAALAAYCQAYGRWAQAEEAITTMAKQDKLTGGLMIKTTNGNAIQNPLVGTANKAAADMVRYAAEFGMTPSARSRLSANAKENGGADEFFDWPAHG